MALWALGPSGQLGTSSSSVFAISIHPVEDQSLHDSDFICLISLNLLRATAGRYGPLFESLPQSFIFGIL